VLVNPDMCLVRDPGGGRIPLHLAKIKGRVGVLAELVTGPGQTGGHSGFHRWRGEWATLVLCVKHNRLETLKVLVECVGREEMMSL
jgi:hypothetical protein